MHLLDINSESVDKFNAMTSNDPFEGTNEPLIYSSENRTPVMIEFNSTIIYIIFTALILALLIILPGVRKTKITSLLGILSFLVIGASILLALGGNNWIIGKVSLNNVPYSSLTRESFTGTLEVNIGLSWTNVTLKGYVKSNENKPNLSATTNLVDYNERFYWDRADEMSKEHIQALRKGLPNPILTVTEFLSQDSEGFNWMRRLRQAGYFSSIGLYITLAAWFATGLIMCNLPVYLPHMMQLMGSLLISSVWIYAFLIQSPKGFNLQINGQSMEFELGYTYVTTFLAGVMSMFAGVVLYILQLSGPHDRLTIMDLDEYVVDQKTQFGLNIVAATHESGKNKPNTNHVMIPIHDIENHFKPASQ